MKKLTARLFSVLLAALLIFSVVLTASAGTLTIKNGKNGETYTAYKIFDATHAGTATTETINVLDEDETLNHTGDKYAYSISDDSQWWSALTSGLTADTNGVYTNNELKLKFTPTTIPGSGTHTVYNVEAINGYSAANFAAFIKGEVDAEGSTYTSAGSVTYSDSAKTISVTDDGYYFVDTTVGTLTALNTADSNADIYEKNDYPNIDKGVSDTAANYDEQTDVSIGDTVYYEIKVTDGVGTDKDIVVTDYMSKALTYNANSIVITSKKGEAAEATVSTDNHDIDIEPFTAIDTDDSDHSDYPDYNRMKITFKGSEFADGEVIYIRYTAVLNEKAALHDSANPNTAKIDYQEFSDTKTADVYTYEFGIFKYADGNVAAPLAGAQFEIKSTKDATETYVKVEEGQENYKGELTYRPAKSGETGTNTITTTASGSIYIVGVDAASYTITEKQAPAGYNALLNPITVQTVGVDEEVQKDSDENYPAGTVLQTGDGGNGTATTDITEQSGFAKIVKINNNKGDLLPSTGGLGTTLFYIGGAVLVLGALVVLIAKKRMKSAD